MAFRRMRRRISGTGGAGNVGVGITGAVVFGAGGFGTSSAIFGGTNAGSGRVFVLITAATSSG